MSVVEERYQKWVNSPNLDARYKEVLENMTPEEKNDAFYTTIEFGTAGMRGLLGPGTNRINIQHHSQSYPGICGLHQGKWSGSLAKRVLQSATTTVT